MEVELHALLTSELDGSEVSFTPRLLYLQGNNPWYSVGRRLGGSQSRSGRDGEEEHSQPLPGIEPRSSALYH